MTKELKPCPFCGSKPDEYRRQDESLWSHAIVEYLVITCSECDGATMEGEEHDRIRAAWNTRPTPEPQAEVRGLVEALEFYADPGTYHATTLLGDRPCGEIADDFSADHGDPDYDRPMLGKHARQALASINSHQGDRLRPPAAQLPNRRDNAKAWVRRMVDEGHLIVDEGPGDRGVQPDEWIWSLLEFQNFLAADGNIPPPLPGAEMLRLQRLEGAYLVGLATTAGWEESKGSPLEFLFEMVREQTVRDIELGKSESQK